MMCKIMTFVLLLCALQAAAQRDIVILSRGEQTNLRGLSVANQKVIWASGSNGRVARSTDGGNNWQWLTVKGFEQKEFRDIKAFDSLTAVIMAIDTPAKILKTIDGGNSWQVVYKNTTAGMFLDAMSFSDKQHGIVAGDPINGKIFLATTNDSGDTWKQLNTAVSRKISAGEAFFAASGSNIVLTKKNNFYLASGGTKSRLFTKNDIRSVPVMQGTATAGANAVAVFNHNIVVAGGDFDHPERGDSCIAYSHDDGHTWHIPSQSPGGYRSDVTFVTASVLIACGLNGIDISKDGGHTWQTVSTYSFNSCRYNKSADAIFFVGQHGTIGTLKL